MAKLKETSNGFEITYSNYEDAAKCINNKVISLNKKLLDKKQHENTLRNKLGYYLDKTKEIELEIMSLESGVWVDNINSSINTLNRLLDDVKHRSEVKDNDVHESEK